MHLTYLTYRTSWLTRGYIKCAQKTSITLLFSKTQSLFYNKVQNISCALLNAVLKVNQTGCLYGRACRLLPLMNGRWPGYRGCCSQLHDRGGDHVLLVGGVIKIHNLKYNYYFHTITKSKNFKMNHHKSE